MTFLPRKVFRPFLERTERYACIVAHRRAGKTVGVIMDLVKKAIECDLREPRFAYIAPTYAQAKDVAWTYLKEYTTPIPGVKISESELSVTLPHNNARIRLYGAENYERLRGLYLDGAAIDETGDHDPRAYPEVIRPALSDRKGWAVFIGTPKGRNAFFDIARNAEHDAGWYWAKLPVSETGLIDETELADARRQMTAEQYEQEYECSFEAAIVGAYYGREMVAVEAEKRATRFAYERAADVEAWWDLGMDDAMSIWIAQRVAKEIRLLDYYENRGFGLDHYVEWIKGLGYPVHWHWWPHDIEVRELQTGKSRKDFLTGRGLKGRGVAQHAVAEGINAVRLALPHCWFNVASEGVRHGMDCLRMYQAEEVAKHGVLRNRPLHNWASHGADSFRTGIMGGPRTTGSLPKWTAPARA